MKGKNIRILSLFALAALLISFIAYTSVDAAIDRDKLEKTRKAIGSMDRDQKIEVMKNITERKYRYTSDIPDFNGKLTVPERDTSAKVIGMETIVLALAKDMKAPQGIAKGSGEEVTWKDVANYEKALLETHDPVNKWFVENLWRARINRVLAEVERKAKEKYPKDYKKIDVSVRDAAISLGIPVMKDGPPIGPLTNQPFIRDGLFGTRLRRVQPEYIDVSLDVFMNNMDEWMNEFWQSLIVALDGATNFTR